MGFTDGRKITGLYRAEVARTERITPNMMRVTLRGDDLARLPRRGYDHWFRLFLPRSEGETNFDAVPDSFTFGSYLKYLAAKSGTRPPFRNYTIRAHRPESAELDIDFVAHGGAGIAGPWAQRAQPGEHVVFIDQGRGFDPMSHTDEVFLAGDESALPAIAGILRDLPPETTGVAIIEVPDAADQQKLDAPAGVQVRWLPRADPHGRPGALALEEVRGYTPDRADGLHAYLAGEQHLVAESRRHLVASGVPKTRISFTGYWKVGRAG